MYVCTYIYTYRCVKYYYGSFPFQKMSLKGKPPCKVAHTDVQGRLGLWMEITTRYGVRVAVPIQQCLRRSHGGL